MSCGLGGSLAFSFGLGTGIIDGARAGEIGKRRWDVPGHQGLMTSLMTSTRAARPPVLRLARGSISKALVILERERSARFTSRNSSKQRPGEEDSERKAGP